MSSKTINITLTNSDLKKAINATVTGPQKGLVARALFVQLSEDNDKAEFFIKATLGIEPELKYSRLENVFIRASGLSDWSWDKEYMEQNGMLKDGHVPGVIIALEPFKTQSYTVRYKYWHKDKKKEISEDYAVGQGSIQLAEEFPEDLI
jgi:hypothetical protein